MTPADARRPSRMFGQAGRSAAIGTPADPAAAGPDAPRKRRDPVVHADGLPKWMIKTGRAAAIVSAGLVVAYGHPYYVCNKQKEAGQLFYGDTVMACVVAQANSNFDYARSVVATVTTGR